jgi:hypothetical protein
MSNEQSEYSGLKLINSSKDSNIENPLQSEIQIESDNISFN